MIRKLSWLFAPFLAVSALACSAPVDRDDLAADEADVAQIADPQLETQGTNQGGTGGSGPTIKVCVWKCSKFCTIGKRTGLPVCGETCSCIFE